jgi:hypothetical protein
VRTITENNTSASVGVRPGYQQLLELVEAKTADIVVVFRLDRLLRKLTDLEALIELTEHTGVSIATVRATSTSATAPAARSVASSPPWPVPKSRRRRTPGTCQRPGCTGWQAPRLPPSLRLRS